MILHFSFVLSVPLRFTDFDYPFGIFRRFIHTTCRHFTLECTGFDICFTGFGPALTTILPILFQYCDKYCYSDSRNLWAVMKAGGLAF